MYLHSENRKKYWKQLRFQESERMQLLQELPFMRRNKTELNPFDLLVPGSEAKLVYADIS